MVNSTCLRGLATAEIVLPPSNTAVIKGEEMKMACLTNNNSRVRKWDIYTTKTEQFTLYSSGKFHKNFTHFNVDVDDNGSGILYTNSTNLSDAGIYKCLSVIDDQDKELNAQLIVLESLPVCQSNLKRNYSNSFMDGENIWIQCSINFRGFWAPSMEWILRGGDIEPEGKSVTDGIETILNSSHRVTSKLTVAVNSSRIGCYYSCKIYFASNSSPKVTTANNVPNFSYTWNSSLILHASPCLSQSFVTATSPTSDSSSMNWYSTLILISLVVSVLSALTVAVVVHYIRRRRYATGSTEQADETTPESKPAVIYENVTFDENSRTGDSQAATYMQLTSLTQASQPVYASIDMDGKMLDMPNNPLPDYKNI